VSEGEQVATEDRSVDVDGEDVCDVVPDRRLIDLRGHGVAGQPAHDARF